ncbi:MAG: hypothetical protein IT473_13540 [Lysobacter sp.]|nr:hypothetical protein [Lysobacter sp.]
MRHLDIGARDQGDIIFGYAVGAEYRNRVLGSFQIAHQVDMLCFHRGSYPINMDGVMDAFGSQCGSVARLR